MSVLSGERLCLSTWLVFLWSVTFAIPLSLATLKLGNQAAHGFRQFRVCDWNTSRTASPSDLIVLSIICNVLVVTRFQGSCRHGSV